MSTEHAASDRKHQPGHTGQRAGPDGDEGRTSHHVDHKHAVRFAEFKLLLKPDELRHIVDAYKLWTHVYRAVDQSGVRFVPAPGDPLILQRDIMFFDTPEFDLYENHFILRRRTRYSDGWTTSHDELTFKFRDPDVARVQAVDVRPGDETPARVKLKREILPLVDQVGGSRRIYTQNCVMAMPPAKRAVEVETLVRLFPVLRSIQTRPGAFVDLVNRVTVSETLSEFGLLDFGHGLAGTVNLALWRDTDTSQAIVSELGFQIKFDRLDEQTEARLEPVEDFFRSVQHHVAHWLFLGTTKTNLVYRRQGREVQNRE